MSRSVNFKCKGPEVETSLANGKAARKPVAERDWTGLDGTGDENRGGVVGKGAGNQVVLDLEGHGEHSESLSDSSSVLPPRILALARSSPGGGRWMGKKSRKFPSGQRTKLKSRGTRGEGAGRGFHAHPRTFTHPSA